MTMKKPVHFVLLILAFIVEIILLNYLFFITNYTPKNTNTLWVQWNLTCYLPYDITSVFSVFLFSIIILGFLVIRYFYIKREPKKQVKQKNNFSLLGAVIQIFKYDVSSAFGFLMILYLLTNIAWAQGFIMDAIKTGEGKYFLYVCLIIIWVSIPYFGITPKSKTNEKVLADDRKFLITTLSIPSGKSLNYPGWYWNWEPLRALFDVYPNIQHLLVIVSEEVETYCSNNLRKDFEKIEKEDIYPNITDIKGGVQPVSYSESEINDFIKIKKDILSITDLFQKTTLNKKLIVTISSIKNQNEFDIFYPLLKTEVEAIIKKNNYKDKEILFALTSGTAVFTSAMAFLSMQGERGCVYTRQDMKTHPNTKTDEFTVNIYTINELWNEIINQSKTPVS